MNYAEESFDFPCSETFHGYTYEYYGEPDPSYIPPQPDLTEIENRLNDLESEVASPGSIPKRYHEQIQQLKSQIQNLQSRVNKLAARKSQPTDFEDITHRYMR